jgi:hypothetical protein
VLEHVFCSRERGCADPKQFVRAVAQRGCDLTRARENLPPLFEREVGGDQRAAALARLDDDRQRTETGDDPIPSRKAPLGLKAGFGALCLPSRPHQDHTTAAREGSNSGCSGP